jgi:hypothetical protein
MNARLFVLFTAVSLVAPAMARAQPAKPGAVWTAKDQARRLADEGQHLFDAGDYKQAILRLQDADSRFAAPTIKLLWAQAHEKLGQLVEARQVYQRVADEKLAAPSSKEFRDAQSTAAWAVARLEKAIPTLSLGLVGDSEASVSLTLDGTPLSAAELGQAMPLDPGKHTLVIERPGQEAETRTVALKEGESRRIEIRRGVAAAVPAPKAIPAPPEAAGRSYVAPAVVFGLGAAGLVAGGITGGIALSKMASFRQRCGPELDCPPSLQSELDGAKMAGHVSTVSFAMGGVGAAVGAVLLLWPVTSSRAPVSVGVGPFGAIATGRF